MTMLGREVLLREYHFDRTGALTTEWTATIAGVATAVMTTNGTDGVPLAVSDAGDSVYLHFGGKLAFPIDDLLALEYLVKIDGFDANTDAVLGMGSAYNVDPGVVAQSAWVRIAQTGKVFLESDDGTTDVNLSVTGATVTNGNRIRVRLDFATGVQTRTPPSRSLGGKSSIQATITGPNGSAIHLKPTAHLDMSAYAGGLQPYFGLRQVTANSGTSPTMRVKNLKIWVRNAA